MKACESTCEFLDSPNDPAAVAPPKLLPSFEKAGDSIGRYKLLQQIGEGGCGVVYMAEQEEPVSRRVALKIIKLGLDTKSVIARFEAERQALALMDHPNIAKVLDAGATEAGRPYFVMELVRGLKITDYCDEKKLTTRARLDLFVQVCQAIQHAHQKGIIHRDIKPSNILVTVNDGVAVPKVIDFGIAKATSGQKLTNKTLFTAFEQFIGTPAYMSPEQAVLTSLDVDTRSDIYALGVLLYELLTGKTPFDAKELFAIGLDEMRRTIREQEPPRPSTRLSTLPGQELSTTAQRRGLDPPKLVSELRGDLDWIVMKALEKDRARRYETASGLAMDIQRHLNNDPVVACPPSNLYRFQKLVRRNRLVFAAAASVVGALLIGLGVATWMFVRERAAMREQSRLRQQAQREASKSAQVANFLKKMLEGVTPSVALGRDTKMLKEILDSTAASISTDLTNQPEVEFELRSTLGGVYYELREFGKAEEMQNQALAISRKVWGDQTLQTAAILHDLSVTMQWSGRHVEAEKLVRNALAIRRSLLGDKAIEVASSLHNLAYSMHWQGKPLSEIESLYREALAIKEKLIGHEDLSVSATLNNLALVLNDQGKLSEAEEMYRESLRIKRRLQPEQTPADAMTLFNLARLLSRQKKLSDAEAAARESLTIRRKVLSDKDSNTGASVGLLIGVLAAENKVSEAESLLNELVASRPRDVARWRGDFLARRGRWKEAVAEFTRAIEQKPDNDKTDKDDDWHKLTALLVATGQSDVYRERCRKSVERFGNTANANTAERIAKDCLILPASGVDLDLVAKMADTAAAVTNHRDAPWFQLVKGLAEYRQGRFASAVEWMNKVLAAPQQDAERNIEAYMVLAMAHYQLKQTDEARAAFARGAEIERAQLPKLESGDIGGGWLDWIIAHALMREAKALIEGGPETKAETK